MNKIYNSRLPLLKQLVLVILLVFMLTNMYSATAQYQLIETDTVEQKPTYESVSDSTITVPSIDQTMSTNPDSFISTWNTELISYLSSNTSAIELPLEVDGKYDFIVDWGDGSTDTITNSNLIDKEHGYETPGIYTINITGTIEGWRFRNGGDRLKIIEISQWGNMSFGNNGRYFHGAQNLVITATDAPDLSSTTSLYKAFWGCENLGNQGDINNWNVSSVTDMTSMFSEASSFNQPLDSWDVSSVTNMSGIFSQASSFNQPLDSWDVSSVIKMNSMFSRATSFNQPLDSWDVSSVTTMAFMFAHSLFNQPLDGWNVSSVTSMRYMFNYASLFNQPLDTWDVSSVTDMHNMFSEATSFNQPISSWDVSSVTSMDYMFSEATSFNQPISSWDVSSVTTMGGMFYRATLSLENYDNLLISWSTLNLQKDVVFNAGYSQYSSEGAAARQQIIDTYNWKISDWGLFVPTQDSEPTDDTNLTDNQSTSIGDQIIPSDPIALEFPISNIAIVLSFLVVIPIARRKQKYYQ